MTTPTEAYEQQLIVMLGNASLTVAKQCAAVTELQNQLAERDAEIAELKKPAKPEAEIHTLKQPEKV